jgi:hypothetical protein
MNKLSSLLSIALISLICACGGKPAKTKQSVIIGTWNLQQQHIVTYKNDTVQVSQESTLEPGKSNATISFNSDGSYTATAVVALSGSLVYIGETDSAGYVGKYSIAADSVITMQPFFTGTLFLDTLLNPPTAVSFSDKIVTETATIDELTSSLLIFDTNIVVSQTINDKNTRIITTNTTYTYIR